MKVFKEIDSAFLEGPVCEPCHLIVLTKRAVLIDLFSLIPRFVDIETVLTYNQAIHIAKIYVIRSSMYGVKSKVDITHDTSIRRVRLIIYI